MYTTKGDESWIREMLSKDTVKMVSLRSQEAQDTESRWAQER